MIVNVIVILIEQMSSGDNRRRSYSVGSFFSRNKSTYGLILPEEFQNSQDNNPKIRPRKTLSCPNDEEMDSKDCFVPSELDNWELPQYQSLLHHLTANQDGRRRLSTTSADVQNLRKNENLKPGPIKAIQRWFRDFVHSLSHDSDEDVSSVCEEDDDDMFPPSSDVVEGIPEDICEKLRYVHIYY